MAAGLAIDLWSKDHIFATLRQGGNRVLLPHVLEFHTTLNAGALFGWGAGHTELFLIASVIALGLVLWMFAQSRAGHWLVHVALGAILAGALGNMYDRAFVRLVEYPLQTAQGTFVRYFVPQLSPDGQWLLLQEYPPLPDHPVHKLPASITRTLPPARGYVRDFIKIPTRWFGQRDVWPWVFNVADMLLVGGVGVLALRMLRERRHNDDAAIVAELGPSGEVNDGREERR